MGFCMKLFRASFGSYWDNLRLDVWAVTRKKEVLRMQLNLTDATIYFFPHILLGIYNIWYVGTKGEQSVGVVKFGVISQIPIKRGRQNFDRYAWPKLIEVRPILCLSNVVGVYRNRTDLDFFFNSSSELVGVCRSRKDLDFFFNSSSEPI